MVQHLTIPTSVAKCRFTPDPFLKLNRLPQKISKSLSRHLGASLRNKGENNEDNGDLVLVWARIKMTRRQKRLGERHQIILT